MMYSCQSETTAEPALEARSKARRSGCSMTTDRLPRKKKRRLQCQLEPSVASVFSVSRLLPSSERHLSYRHRSAENCSATRERARMNTRTKQSAPPPLSTRANFATWQLEKDTRHLLWCDSLQPPGTRLHSPTSARPRKCTSERRGTRRKIRRGTKRA